MKLTFSDKARSDLRRIYAYLSVRNTPAADTLLRRINEKFVSLSRFPFIGRPRPIFGSGLRGVLAGSYIIFYIADSDQIEIVRVIHGSMDIDEEFGR